MTSPAPRDPSPAPATPLERHQPDQQDEGQVAPQEGDNESNNNESDNESNNNESDNESNNNESDNESNEPDKKDKKKKKTKKAPYDDKEFCDIMLEIKQEVEQKTFRPTDVPDKVFHEQKKAKGKKKMMTGDEFGLNKLLFEEVARRLANRYPQMEKTEKDLSETLKSRWHYLRNNWYLPINRSLGSGREFIDGRLVMDDEEWDRKIRDEPTVYKKLRRSPFPAYDTIHAILQGKIATGTNIGPGPKRHPSPPHRPRLSASPSVSPPPSPEEGPSARRHAKDHFMESAAAKNRKKRDTRRRDAGDSSDTNSDDGEEEEEEEEGGRKKKRRTKKGWAAHTSQDEAVETLGEITGLLKSHLEKSSAPAVDEADMLNAIAKWLEERRDIPESVQAKIIDKCLIDAESRKQVYEYLVKGKAAGLLKDRLFAQMLGW
ncbi:hypothetical protein B9479_008276 [Cryptococcus floricola]|uniref:Uncharacterized protein n=1 Tax=Cryptococcus floricola TaxID=2591691 RepID=A0A5D3ALA3_9TREE|nr:hypothetical protein B9479_008276 [Cryptococcus floricola]